MPLPTKVSDAVRRLNPQLFPSAMMTNPEPKMGSRKRIRQHQGDGMNKTERAFLAYLQVCFPGAMIHREPALPIANGCVFKVDFLVAVGRCDSGVTVDGYEVKGKHAWDDAIVKIKVAARFFPWIRFHLCTPCGAGWTIEAVLP